LHRRRERFIEVWQENDSILIAAGGMNDDPGARRSALVPWRMGYICRDEDLLAAANVDATF
jgi:hypothetical protein